MLARIGERAGLPKGRLHPHIFRHTLATSIVSNGGSLSDAQVLLDHAKPETTLIYMEVRNVDPDFTDGPYKISGKFIGKFNRKRIGKDHIDAEDFVDGLNSALHGSRARAFPAKDGKVSLIIPDKDGGHVWHSVIAPHEGFTGVATGYRPDFERIKKELAKSSEGRPFPSYPNGPEVDTTKSGTLPGRLTTVEDSEKPVDNTVSNDDFRVKKNGASAAILGGPGVDGDVVGDGLLRQFLLGTRGVLEGAGGVADYVRAPLNWANGALGGDPDYFKNPGAVLSDALSLPVPQNDTERSRVGLNQGVSGALAESAAGGGIAQYGAGKAAEFGKFLADSPFLNGTLGGILGYFTGGER